MNNLINKKSYINSNYLNDKEFYNIKKNNWSESFDIEFETNINNLNLLNLFLILKSYLFSSNTLIKNIFIYGYEYSNKNNIILLKQLDINILYKINFLDFVSLMYNVNIYENNYINDMNISGIRIVLYSIYNNELYEPIYPWSKEWLNYLGITHTL